jgi:hypothetical protein
MLTQTTRIKVKNPDYTQAEGRQKSYSTSGADVALEMSPMWLRFQPVDATHVQSPSLMGSSATVRSQTVKNRLRTFIQT